MSVYVFVGPTLSHEEARTELDAIYLPPAAQGDVYRAALRRPRAIGIIDGYFESVPSIYGPHRTFFEASEVAIVAIFTLEYLINIYVAHDRVRYDMLTRAGYQP